MRQFFKIFFASLFGTIFGICILVFLLLAIIVGVSSSSLIPAQYEDSSVIVFDGTMSIGEISTPESPSFMNSIAPTSQLGLADIVTGLERAAKDDKIKGIVIDDVTIDAGYATISELASAIQKFKESGKFAVAYFTTMSQKNYLLASACDEISMNGEGMAEFHGISSSSIHYKYLLEKAGLNPVVIRCGKYKSYVESMTNDKMSAENREQKQAYIDYVWKSYGTQVQKQRSVTGSQLNVFADSVLVCLPRELQAYGFIDKIQYSDEFWKSVKTQLNLKDDKKVPKVSIRTYIDTYAQQEQPNEAKDKIALVVAQGSIDMGKSDESSIGSETYMKLFQKVRKDSTVKSVVFRINSGGGSALASELIWREVALTAQEKPVIVSMGDVAASGGYYIASPATKIVAAPMGLTGSIGVFALSMTAENLLKKIGVSVDNVNTHSHSDFGNISRPMESTELKALEKSIDQTYLTFKTRVAEGRHIPIDSVEAIAQGRIWGINDAVRIGLVDQIGGLADAIDVAKNTAQLQDYKIVTYPQQKTWVEMFSNAFESEESMVEKLDIDPQLKEMLKSVPTQSGIYTQLPYNITIQ